MVWTMAIRLLLLLFPPSFREEYGPEWRELALHRLAAARRAPAKPRAFLRLLWETVRTAPVLWWARDPRGESPHTPHESTMDTLFQDMRFGLRTLRRRPLFTLMAVATLGVGIGASTAIFSVVDGVLLRPLPFQEPQELVSIWQTYPEWRDEPMLAQGWDWGYLSYPGYERLRNGQGHFRDVAIYGSTLRNLSGAGDPHRIRVGIASSSLFPVLGVELGLGRAFLPEEDREGGPRVAILSHAFWSETFGADPEVLGQGITLDQAPFTVVGVLPEGFQLLDHGVLGGSGAKPIWIPVGADGNRRADNSHSYEAVARLSPGASMKAAIPEAANLVAAPDEEPGHSVRMVPLEELELQGLRAPLLLLLGASLVLLLIACGNMATLLLGEMAGRRHEMATRTALGANGNRLVRQLLTESVLLGVAGSALGLGVAVLGTRGLLGLAPPLPRLDLVKLHPDVLLFATGVGTLTGLLFGLAPAWEVTGSRLRDTISRGRGVARRGSRLQSAVISLELALTVVLLVSGILLSQSLSRLLSVDTGFQREGLAMIRAYLPGYRYGDTSDRAVQTERMRVSLESVPGVLMASGTSSLPFYNGPNALSYGVEGREVPEQLSPHASSRAVLPGFFETMGIRITEGRGLTEADGSRENPVVVISETMARRHWADSSPIGARILFGDTLEVVGVAADVVHESLDAEPLATLYVPFATAAGTAINFLVRTAGDPRALFPALRQAVWEVDAETPISRVATVRSLIRASTQDERFRSVLILVFAACATLLAGAGVFGVTARAAAQRTREMGIRKALGARPGSLVQLSLSGTVRVALAGVALGLLTAVFASQLLTRFLFQVEPWEPGVYLGTGGGLLVLSLAASMIPAFRAGRVPPMEALREE